MKASKKVHFGAGLVAVVLAIALWPVTAKPQDKPAPPEKPRPGARSLRQEMARDLFDITSEQEKKLQELREARRRDHQAFREETVRMRGEMRDLMKDPKANAAKIEKLIDGRARLRAEREKQVLRSRGEREKNFTPEQLEKMRKYRDIFRERVGAGAGWRAGAGRPEMAQYGAPWAPRGWRMRAAAWRWRHPYALWHW